MQSVVSALGTAVLAAFLVGTSALDESKLPGVGHASTYFGWDSEYEITIESGNGVMSTLSIPKGVSFSIQFPSTSIPSEPPGFPRVFQGDLVISVRRMDEVLPVEGRKMRDIMSKAPFTLDLKDVKVVVNPK